MMTYFIVAVVLLALGVLTVFSIGVYLIFLALAMVSVAWARGRRPWLVEGTIVGAVVFAVAHFLTTPLSCSTTSTLREGVLTELASCERILLPDLHGLDVVSANWLALGIAALAGVGTGLLVLRFARRRARIPVA
jgi:hypothetical protein